MKSSKGERAFDLYCAVDLLGGAAVRLAQGDFDRRREFGDPIELCHRFLGAGAHWLHVVDLDAARTGEPANGEVVRAIAREASVAGASVQCGGGVRSAEHANFLLEGGVERVVVGTAAQRDPEFLQELCSLHPGRVAVGLDHREQGAEVSVSGWQSASGTGLDDALVLLEPLDLAALVITSIERDGMLAGPDLNGLRRVLSKTSHPVIASGGVRSVSDLSALASMEVEGRSLIGAVVGMALVDGTLAVEEALKACETSA